MTQSKAHQVCSNTVCLATAAKMDPPTHTCDAVELGEPLSGMQTIAIAAIITALLAGHGVLPLAQLLQTGTCLVTSGYRSVQVHICMA